MDTIIIMIENDAITCRIMKKIVPIDIEQQSWQIAWAISNYVAVHDLGKNAISVLIAQFCILSHCSFHFCLWISMYIVLLQVMSVLWWLSWFLCIWWCLILASMTMSMILVNFNTVHDFHNNYNLNFCIYCDFNFCFMKFTDIV